MRPLSSFNPSPANLGCGSQQIRSATSLMHKNSCGQESRSAATVAGSSSGAHRQPKRTTLGRSRLFNLAPQEVVTAANPYHFRPMTAGAQPLNWNGEVVGGTLGGYPAACEFADSKVQWGVLGYKHVTKPSYVSPFPVLSPHIRPRGNTPPEPRLTLDRVCLKPGTDSTVPTDREPTSTVGRCASRISWPQVCSGSFLWTRA